jgi:thymidylate synthase (FAD)
LKVSLLTHTPEPEKIIATAAKLCYSSSTIDNLQEGLTEEKVTKFIEMLISLGHESPVEHVTFTFGIEGISRACSHQLVRHRIASYSQKSQRYVNEIQFEYVTPPTIKNSDLAVQAAYETAMAQLNQSYKFLQGAIKADLIEKGIDAKAAEKMANEDARFVLPNACTTSIIVTMNIRSLFNFFAHRCCNRAQWEIQELANEMFKLCYEVSPLLFKNAGPNCIAKGKCPEGKMTCGKYTEVKEFFDNLKKTP